MIARYVGRSIIYDLEAQVVRFFRATRKPSSTIAELFFQNFVYTFVLYENRLQFRKNLAHAKQAAQESLNRAVTAGTELILAGETLSGGSTSGN